MLVTLWYFKRRLLATRRLQRGRPLWRRLRAYGRSAAKGVGEARANRMGLTGRELREPAFWPR